jgi:hypothetical protein
LFGALENSMSSNSNEIAGERKMIVHAAAHATVDHVDGPSFCRFVVTAELARRLREVRALAEAHRLSEVRFWALPERWGAGHTDVEDEISLEAGEIVVCPIPDAFWFNASMKHVGGSLQTVTIDSEALLAAFDAGQEHYAVEVDEDLEEEIRRDEARERGEPWDDDDDEDADADDDDDAEE